MMRTSSKPGSRRLVGDEPVHKKDAAGKKIPPQLSPSRILHHRGVNLAVAQHDSVTASLPFAPIPSRDQERGFLFFPTALPDSVYPSIR